MAIDQGLEIDVSVPADAIKLGFDADGLPRVEPINPEPEAAPPAPAARTEPEPPKVTEEDLETARWQAQQVQRERDRAQQMVDQERGARERAEQELQTRTSQAIRAHMHAVNSEHQQFLNGISAVKLEADAAKRELEMLETDETLEPRERARRKTEAHERLASAASDLRTLDQARSAAEDRLNDAKRAVEAMGQVRERERPREEPARQETREAPKQTVEEWISQYPPITQRWLNSHKDYVTNPKLYRKLMNFAAEYVDDNGQEKLHSSEFISALDARFFPKREEPAVAATEIDTAAPASPEEPRRTATAPAAPVTRTAAGGNGRNSVSGKVRLTNEEMQAAMRMNPNLSPEQALLRYAQNIKRLERDGIRRD